MPAFHWASYFRADHSIVLSVYPFGELFLCHPSLGESYFQANHLILHPLVSHFRVDHITLHPSILFGELFCAVHPLGELFSCLPFNSPSLWRVIFELSNPRASYFRAYYLILHTLASYFHADNLTLHQSIPLASYFCATHPLGELFLYCPTFG